MTLTKWMSAPLLLLLAAAGVAEERVTLAPLEVPQHVASTDDLIRAAAERHSWRVRDTGADGWTVALENYKGRTLVMRIVRSDGGVGFEYVSERREDCEDCRIKAGHYNRWISNLRRSIALEIHQSAIQDARAAWERSRSAS